VGDVSDPSGLAVDLAAELDRYVPRPTDDVVGLARLRQLVSAPDPWSRSAPLHVTGSAVVVHPPTRRVLLRWHERMGRWLHVGGHVDPGETTALAAAFREAREETGLVDLYAWPDARGTRPAPVHVVIVPVPPGRGEPAHEHADVRYILATDRPDEIVPESDTARLWWLPVGEAMAAVGPDDGWLTETFTRVTELFDRLAERDQPSTSR
jgi:8-oxo-dGTP pyrophosphatase MutT (NUDIX family)